MKVPSSIEQPSFSNEEIAEARIKLARYLGVGSLDDCVVDYTDDGSIIVGVLNAHSGTVDLVAEIVDLPPFGEERAA